MTRLIVAFMIVGSSFGAAFSQGESAAFVWDNNLPNCDGRNAKLEPGTISCSVTYSYDSRRLTFQHKVITLSMSHVWSGDNLRVIVTVENAGDVNAPVDVKLWNLTAYKSLQDLIANREPILNSRAKKPVPLVNSSGMLNTSTTGLPSNSPVERHVTREQTTNPTTGQILNPNTKVIGNPIGISHTVISSSATGSPGKRYSSATKWTEVAARSLQIGEVRFPIERDTTYVAVSLNINGSTYIYRLKRR